MSAFFLLTTSICSMRAEIIGLTTSWARTWRHSTANAELRSACGRRMLEKSRSSETSTIGTMILIRSKSRGASGIWEGFIPGIDKGEIYKFHILSHNHDFVTEKADPFGTYHEQPPRTASVVWDLDYKWSDAEWMNSRRQPPDFAISNFDI